MLPIKTEPIPTIIHMVWIGPSKPDWVDQVRARWQALHPGWQVMMHGKEVLLPELEKAYNQAWRRDMRSDLLRLCALRRFGGFYVDCDMVPVRSLDDLRPRRKMIVLQFRDGNLGNGFMGSTKDNRTLVQIMEHLTYAGALHRETFGPEVLRRYAEGLDRLTPRHWLNYYQPGVVSMAERLLDGEDVSAQLRQMMSCNCALPFMLHAGTYGGDMEHGRFKIVPTRHAAAILPATVIKHLGGRLLDAYAARGINLGIYFLDGWKPNLDHIQNRVIWNDRHKGTGETLYVENGLLSQRHGCYMDPKGYFSDSSIVTAPDPDMSPEAVEKLRKHVRACFGWELWQEVDPNGPVMVALQKRDDLGCRKYYDHGGEDPTVKLLQWCIDNLGDMPVLLRPHPRHPADWQKTQELLVTKGITLPSHWQIDTSKWVYETLLRCRALVTINSTLATEAQCLKMPIVCLGRGAWTGSGAVRETATVLSVKDLLSIEPWHALEPARFRYLLKVLEKQVRYVISGLFINPIECQ